MQRAASVGNSAVTHAPARRPVLSEAAEGGDARWTVLAIFVPIALTPASSRKLSQIYNIPGATGEHKARLLVQQQRRVTGGPGTLDFGGGVGGVGVVGGRVEGGTCFRGLPRFPLVQCGNLLPSSLLSFPSLHRAPIDSFPRRAVYINTSKVICVISQPF